MKLSATVVNTLQSGSIAGALSRAATERAGGAPIEPMIAESTLPALDSNPTSIIRAVGGQDGLCKASSSLLMKSCPQPSRNNALNQSVRQLEQIKQEMRGGNAADRSSSSEDGGDRPATPYTDRGVEMMEINK